MPINVVARFQRKLFMEALSRDRKPDADFGSMCYELDTNKVYEMQATGWTELVTEGGAGVWGAITGTLSDQTDLQTALDAKATAAALAAHEAAGDPHAQYLTDAEADALYDALGDADAAVAAHAAAGDPHAGYLTAAEGNAAYQALDSDLTTLAANITAAGHALVDDASAADQRATLGLVIGTNVQAQDAELAAIAGLTSAADRLPYFTGSGTGALAVFTAQARLLLDDADAAAQLATIGAAAASHNHAATEITSGVLAPARLAAGSALQFLRRDAANTALEFATLAGGGDMLAANNLSDLADDPSARANLFASGPLVFVGTNGALFGAGSASANSWPKLTAGTLLTTPEAGALELDANCFYGTTDAGNRGYIPVTHLIRADATRTFASDTNQQAIFTTPAGGALTLETGTYLFEGLIAITAMSATSGNGKFSLIGAGSATLAAILWQAYGGDVAAESAAAAIGGSWHVIATQTAVNVVTAATGTAVCFYVKGTFEVTGAGTIIPSFAQTNAAAAVVSIGSFLTFHRIGPTSLTAVGQWS